MTIYINGFKASKKAIEYLQYRIKNGLSKAVIKTTKKHNISITTIE